jgi:hypothetical protein
VPSLLRLGFPIGLLLSVFPFNIYCGFIIADMGPARSTNLILHSFKTPLMTVTENWTPPIFSPSSLTYCSQHFVLKIPQTMRDFRLSQSFILDSVVVPFSRVELPMKIIHWTSDTLRWNRQDFSKHLARFVFWRGAISETKREFSLNRCSDVISELCKYLFRLKTTSYFIWRL